MEREEWREERERRIRKGKRTRIKINMEDRKKGSLSPQD